MVSIKRGCQNVQLVCHTYFLDPNSFGKWGHIAHPPD